MVQSLQVQAVEDVQRVQDLGEDVQVFHQVGVGVQTFSFSQTFQAVQGLEKVQAVREQEVHFQVEGVQALREQAVQEQVIEKALWLKRWSVEVRDGNGW